MSSQPTRIHSVVLVEDRSEDLRFITSVVEDAFGKNVRVESARTLAKARAILHERSKPDLVVLDLNLPDGPGASLLPFIREHHPNVWVVVATVFDDDEHLFVALQQGADGYLLKEESRMEAARLLREILAGRPPLSARVARRVLKFIQRSSSSSSPSGVGSVGSSAPVLNNSPAAKSRSLPTLTAREREVLTLLASGHTAISAAALLNISEHTIKTHVKNLYRKLDVSSRASMVRAALDEGPLP